MPSATVTSKGQITVPKGVRDALGVQPGDRLAFRVGADGTVTVEAETVDVRSLKGIIKASVRGISIDDMNDAIRRSGGRK